MSRMIWGACCAVFTVVFLTAIVWLPAGADEADSFKGEKETAPESSATYQEIPPSPEIAAERAAERRINKTLDTMLHAPMEYIETPLNEVLSILHEDYDIPIEIDQVALDAIAISSETEISVNLRYVTLRSALELILAQIEDITFTFKNEVLLITSRDAAAENLSTRIYCVNDIDSYHPLKRLPESEADYSPLIHVITRCVHRDSWSEFDTGEGEIYAIESGILVIVQTPRVHREIQNLLASIRSAQAIIRVQQ